MAEGGRSSHSSDEEITSRLPVMSRPRDLSPSPSSDVELRDSVSNVSRPPSSLTERGLAVAQPVGSDLHDLLNRTLGQISPSAGPIPRDERLKSEPRLPCPFFPSEEDRNRVRRNLFDVAPDDHPIIAQPYSTLARTFPRSNIFTSKDYDPRIRVPGSNLRDFRIDYGDFVNRDVTNRDKVDPFSGVYNVNIIESSGEHDDIYTNKGRANPDEITEVHKIPTKNPEPASLRSLPFLKSITSSGRNKITRTSNAQTNVKTIYGKSRAAALHGSPATGSFGRSRMSV